MTAQRDMVFSLILGLAVIAGLVLASFVTDVAGVTGFALALGALLTVGLLIGAFVRRRSQSG